MLYLGMVKQLIRTRTHSPFLQIIYLTMSPLHTYKSIHFFIPITYSPVNSSFIFVMKLKEKRTKNTRERAKNSGIVFCFKWNVLQFSLVIAFHCCYIILLFVLSNCWKCPCAACRFVFWLALRFRIKQQPYIATSVSFVFNYVSL